MNKLKDIKTKLYAFAFFDDFILIYPLYTLMFADAGLKPVQISSLLIVWSFTAFALEVPTGAIADRYPRRNVLLVGIILRVAGYLFWLLMRNYLGFLIGFILWGIKSAITSGTLEALVYDELTRVNKLKAYAKIMGRMDAAGAMGVILAGFGASLLARHGYDIILWLSVAAIAVSGLAIYSLPKPPRVRRENEPSQFALIRKGMAAVLSKPKVFFLVTFMSVVAGLGAVDEYFNLFFREKGFSNTAVAFWIAVVFSFGAVGSLLAHRLEGKKIPAKSALFMWAALLFFISIAPKILAPFLLGIYVMFFFAVGVLFNTYLQKEIDSEARATTTSVGGFFAELFAIGSFIIVGFGAKVSYAFSFRLIAITITILALFLVWYSRKHTISI